MATGGAPFPLRFVGGERELRVHLAALQAALDEEDATEVERQLDEIARLRESPLFIEMGRITRQLHEALVGLQLAPEVASLAEHEIPAARVRLDYVLKKTEQAAHRTLTAVEAALPLAAGMRSEAGELSRRWQGEREGELTPESFRQQSLEAEQFLARVSRDSAAVGERLSEVLMAQDFQDLTGQVIRRVVDVMQEVQDELVVQMRKRVTAEQLEDSPVAVASRAEGPQVKASPAANIVQSQDDVDALLSSLGF